MKTKDIQSLEEAYNHILFKEQEEVKSPKEQTSVRYEHRVIKKFVTENPYGGTKPVVFNVGEVLEKTKHPGKKKYYGSTMGHGVGVDIPAKNVGVFKITRTVTETEEPVD